MLIAGIGFIILGYAFAYSGISNITTGGKGWGLFKSLLNKGDNSGVSFGSFLNDIQPQGNAGSAEPTSAAPPVKGTTQV